MENNKKEFPTSVSTEQLENWPQDAQDFIKIIDGENKQLKTKVEELKKEQGELLKEVDKLNGMLRLNSSNSSKPPSSDGLKKKNTIPGSQRISSGKKAGAQHGHTGSTLESVENPNKIIAIEVVACKSCKADLSQVKVNKMKSTQVFDLPPIQMDITEYQAECKECPECGVKNVASYPEGVRDVPVQYGSHIKSNALFLMTRHLVPPRRVSEILEAVTGYKISIGSIMNWQKEVFFKLAPFEKMLEEMLINSTVLHFDETGMRVTGKLHWLHSASTKLFTLFRMHPKRGLEAMNEFNILPRFKEVAVHDAWSSYFGFKEVSHALCGSHLLRELKFLLEEFKEDWAGKMSNLLLSGLKEVNQAKLENREFLISDVKIQIRQNYQEVLAEGLKFHEKDIQSAELKRGRVAQTKGKNLLDRLKNYEEEVLRYTEDFNVPFTNNISEQDLRMNKVKQKISGCFRSFEAATYYCRVRSYLSTCAKHKKNLHEALNNIFSLKPEQLFDYLL